MTRQCKAILQQQTTHADGGATLSARVSACDAGRIHDAFQPGEVITLTIRQGDLETEDAVSYIRTAAVKIASRTGETTRQVKQRLQERAGTKKSGVYVILRDGERLDAGTYVVPRYWAGALREDWQAYAVMKSFSEYEGEELRRLLRGLNRMLKEAGIPESERLTERGIEFYVDKKARERGDGDV